MTLEDKEYYKELAFRGLKASILVSYGYFCGEPKLEENKND